VNFKEDFFFGINLNIHEVYIENNLYHFETNFDENSAVKSILYEDRLLTIGELVFHTNPQRGILFSMKHHNI